MCSIILKSYCLLQLRRKGVQPRIIHPQVRSISSLHERLIPYSGHKLEQTLRHQHRQKVSVLGDESLQPFQTVRKQEVGRGITRGSHISQRRVRVSLLHTRQGGAQVLQYG